MVFVRNRAGWHGLVPMYAVLRFAHRMRDSLPRSCWGIGWSLPGPEAPLGSHCFHLGHLRQQQLLLPWVSLSLSLFPFLFPLVFSLSLFLFFVFSPILGSFFSLYFSYVCFLLCLCFFFLIFFFFPLSFSCSLFFLSLFLSLCRSSTPSRLGPRVQDPQFRDEVAKLGTQLYPSTDFQNKFSAFSNSHNRSLPPSGPECNHQWSG